ncbi:hypothetical protein EZJ19_06165 [Parasulfuritortus cantonensis]|uniref:Uncharacterized protein n=1 Tax=Parasulfuritortus cantonensis TaxID=2528202 RepID=A0A4R1BFI0_9PROT|nr:hypothetical protein [Parasulfuritortus cantonensis]TCJ15798.1 hypothetical protein EZJ19_06165 [Parasulfuritortus cantonensis]
MSETIFYKPEEVDSSALGVEAAFVHLYVMPIPDAGDLDAYGDDQALLPRTRPGDEGACDFFSVGTAFD